MHNQSSLKQEFLQKWVMGLQMYNSSTKGKNIMERKKVIKLSADVAMASTRKAKTCWSRAVIDNASKDDYNRVLVDRILGPEAKTLMKPPKGMVICDKRTRSKKILKRSGTARRMRKIAPQVVWASSIAKRLVKKRTQILKRLVPGGEFMDEFSLLKEALDYMISLRVQVDVMRQLVDSSELLNDSKVTHV